jgi:hypothetical protein
MDDGERVICTCLSKPDSAFNVIMKMKGVDFDAAKIIACEIIGRGDLIVEPGKKNNQQAAGCTLAQLAEAKGFAVDYLQELGAEDHDYHGTPAVKIPYYGPDGSISAIRYRIALTGKDKNRWRKNDTTILYGSDQAQHLAARGYAVIVEGETDTWTCWTHRIPAIGLPGATNWKEERDAALLADVETIYVVIEPDTGGTAILRWLATSAIAPRTRLVRLPAETKDPSALYLANPGNFKEVFQGYLGAAEPFSAQQHDAEKESAQEAVNDGVAAVTLDDLYAYLPAHSYLYVPTNAMWPAASVDSQIPPIQKDGGDKGIKASGWLDRHRAVQQMTWAPGEPNIIKDRLPTLGGGWVDKPGAATYNLYRPPAVDEGADPAYAQRWIDHVRLIYPDDAAHIIQWCAHRVQRPGEKLNHALVFAGEPGVGKDTILVPVRYAIGAWNFQEANPEQVLDKYNDFLKSVIVRVSEAHDIGDANRFKLYERLKSAIAAPPEFHRINEKHLREYPITNVCGVVLTTNHLTDGLYIPANDRRHYVAWTDLKKEDEQFADGYFVRLYSYFENGGNAAVAAYLRQLDISDFDPKAPPPLTPAFWQVVQSNSDPEALDLAEAIEKLRGDPEVLTGPEVLTIEALRQIGRDGVNGDLVDWLSDRKNRRSIPHKMDRCQYTPVRNPDHKDGQWKIGGKYHSVYALKSLGINAQLTAARDLVEAGTLHSGKR